MADETPGAQPQQPAQAAVPMLNLVGQYVRDLSFENPNAPASIMAGAGQPQFNVSINVGVKKQTDDLYAVELTFNAKAEREKVVLFNVELVYGGVFRVRNVPEAQLPLVLMIECPRLIFPFARQVLANVTQQGGFPPLMMDPVDFAQIYRQNLAALAAQQQAGTAPKAPDGGTIN
jgi:preprotein translocase subunit SecB